jgi:hypothetical protein
MIGAVSWLALAKPAASGTEKGLPAKAVKAPVLESIDQA